MKPGKPLRRKTLLARETPVRKRNPKRWQANQTRAYGGPERAAWYKAQPCLICGAVPSENAHVPSHSGMSRKGDARWNVPLCHTHHQTAKDSLHALNKAGFEAKHGVDLEQVAQVYDARWQQHVATAPQKEVNVSVIPPGAAEE